MATVLVLARPVGVRLLAPVAVARPPAACASILVLAFASPVSVDALAFALSAVEAVMSASVESAEPFCLAEAETAVWRP